VRTRRRLSAAVSAVPDPAGAARYVAEVAPLLGLPIPPECRDAVVRNVAGLLAAGLLILDFAIGEFETAPVFRP
jgi:1-carboxybiuret hydrolase subunit AtzG-like protein